jgi:hypothetical protein
MRRVICIRVRYGMRHTRLDISVLLGTITRNFYVISAIEVPAWRLAGTLHMTYSFPAFH